MCKMGKEKKKKKSSQKQNASIAAKIICITKGIDSF